MPSPPTFMSRWRALRILWMPAYPCIPIWCSPAKNGVPVGPSVTLPGGNTPASLGCVYGVGPSYAGCKIPGLNQHPTGGWGAIALVDAYDNPDAATDYTTFSSTFHLPTTGFSKFGATGGTSSCSTVPTPPGGHSNSWALEPSLDIEWAHAMAPSAKIILVEACSSSYTDLLNAELLASQKVAAAGGGDISNSWGSGEFSGETADDLYFYFRSQAPQSLPIQVPNITYFASAGDSGCGADYPSSSPWVVSARGTAVNCVTSGLKKGNFSGESCWSGSGGGSSIYETYGTVFSGANTGPWADYQYPIFAQSSRQTPDYAFDADPNTGVDVLSGYYLTGGWFVVGGTSVASPALAGITNLAGQKLGSYSTLPLTGHFGYYTNEEDNLLYAQLPGAKAYANNFFDITTGGNGCFVGPKWDYCTGIGSPRGLNGK
jgi:kumamolisin